MYRENLENKINKLQLWKKRDDSDIQVQSLLDQEMAKMSPSKKMSTSSPMMHFDESMESNVDSDLEDGEIRKLLTSQLYAQEAGGRPDAMDIQESEVNAQTSHSSEGREAAGETGCIVFHQNVMNRETKRGVLCSETLMCRI